VREDLDLDQRFRLIEHRPIVEEGQIESTRRSLAFGPPRGCGGAAMGAVNGRLRTLAERIACELPIDRTDTTTLAACKVP
jgi:hypothetical protein